MNTQSMPAKSVLIVLTALALATFGDAASAGDDNKNGQQQSGNATGDAKGPAVSKPQGTQRRPVRIVRRGRGGRSSGRSNASVQLVQANQLPPAVIQAAQTGAPNVRFTRFEKHANRQVVSYYVLQGRDPANRLVTLRVSPAGKVIGNSNKQQVATGKRRFR